MPSETVHETPTTVAFKDINPAAPLHVLVVPRRHIDRRLDRDAPRTAPSWPTCSWRPAPWPTPPDWPCRSGATASIFNVGPDAMNSVPHLHLHVLGGEPLKGHFAAT